MTYFIFSRRINPLNWMKQVLIWACKSKPQMFLTEQNFQKTGFHMSNNFFFNFALKNAKKLASLV